MSYGINSIEDLPEQHRAEALEQMMEGYEGYVRPKRIPTLGAVYQPEPTRRTEHQEQEQLFQWARMNESRWPGLRWMFAIPNGGKRATITAVRLRAEGVKAGVPDVFCLCRWLAGAGCG